MLVAAHGNSIRALRKHLEGIADDAITELEVPTGIPYRMRLNDDLTVRSAEYLGDPEAAAAAAAAVARQADQPPADPPAPAPAGSRRPSTKGVGNGRRK